MPKTRIEFDQIQELHKVTPSEVTAGYFLLNYTPDSPESVVVYASGGPTQVNKSCVDVSGETPDFEVKNIVEFHFNGNGGATGLSGHIKADDILIVYYDYGVE
jgi:hypothetical protein